MDRLSDACQVCVNTVTDVFIQYTQSLDVDTDFAFFETLWLSFMRVLLQYFDQASQATVEAKAVLQTIQDNL